MRSRQILNAYIDPVLLFLSDADDPNFFVEVNDAAIVRYGYSRHEFINMCLADISADLDFNYLAIFDTLLHESVMGRSLGRTTHRTKHGELFPVELFLSSIDLEQNSYFMLIVRDRSEQVEMLKTLNACEEKIEAAFHISPDVICLSRLSDGAYDQINQRFTEFMGYQPEEVIGTTSIDLSIWKNTEDRNEFVRQLQDNGLVENMEVEFISKDGTVKVGLVSARISNPSEEAQVYSIVRDITERKKTAEDLKLMSFALDHISEEVHLSDGHGRFVYVNQQACKALGYKKDELVKKMITDIDPSVTPVFLEASRRDLIDLKTLTHESTQMRRDGSTYPVEITENHFEYAGHNYSLTLVRDIAERKRNEEVRRQFEKRMMEAQKLESLEVLAGGVAHDFNNLLAAIMGHAELTKRRLPPDSKAIKNLYQIEQAAERAADLAKQMLAYSGKGKIFVETVDLNQLLEEILPMLRVSVPQNIDVQLNPGRFTAGVDVDATQIRQIIMNLILNASEAIGDASGTISITTDCIQCSADFLKHVWLNKNLSAGLYVSLEVNDDGCGMNEETLSKLFDPFFTTKFTGRGLGLSAVLGILRGHKGAFKVESEEGQGTLFKVLLPASKKVIAVANLPEIEDDWQGKGTVLLVDDEAAVRRSCAALLEELGFTAITAYDGLQALDVFMDHPEICFVLLDLTMPKLNGEKCFYELRKICPDIQVIMSSGYSESEIEEKLGGKGLAGFLQKPYRLSALMSAIRNMEKNRNP
jgi:PAS domain S-box-containing protein